MEKPGTTRNVGGIEENILAILDSSEAKDNQDAYEDRITFLEAVRAASIVPKDGTPPTYAMFEAIFSILRIGKSLELTMESFQLLNELDKRFPRVYSSDVDNSTSSSSVPELIVVEEAWYPFASFENASNERGATSNSGGPVDSSGFQLLIQDLADATDEANFQASETKTLANMLLFQYLINVLEWDFLPRNRIYKETMNWVVLRESLVNMLLVSRKVNQKSLTKDCLTIMCKLYQTHAGFTDDLICSKKSVAQPAENFDAATAIALLEIGKNTCIAMQKFLVIIMELDVSKQSADIQGSTTRADGIRTPLLEIILDELTYNKDILDPFLQVFDEPKWKLEMVVKYLWKYIAKPSIRTRRSNGPPDDDASFNGALKCLSNITSAKSTIKKIRTEVVQLLLAHGFQAHLSLPCENHLVGDASASDEEKSSSSLVEICENIISAFKNMKDSRQAHGGLVTWKGSTIYSSYDCISKVIVCYRSAAHSYW
ncbi:negative regulator of systemic acquired resistance SNI1 [Pyrus x bretschneideri]|uniref:negative regulator of systemic acquired resistance SNI1 n=1 Tax=Pyrus x bretschneideri TaxID=225117 RepID=UPI00202E4280|nr:negative regulator of systemic acquired resistance SNI1 [Pyrus x bretschneideri]